MTNRNFGSYCLKKNHTESGAIVANPNITDEAVRIAWKSYTHTAPFIQDVKNPFKCDDTAMIKTNVVVIYRIVHEFIRFNSYKDEI